MNAAFRLAWHLHKRRLFRRLRSGLRLWLILFLFHQFFTFPLLCIFLNSLWLDWDSDSPIGLAAIAKQGRIDNSSAVLTVIGILICVLGTGSVVFLFYRRRRERRERQGAFARFKKFRDDCLKYQNQTGYLPVTIRELARINKKYGNPFYDFEYRCLSFLDIGVIASTFFPISTSFVQRRFASRLFVALEDGSIVRIRGRRSVEFFSDAVWIAKAWKSPGKFYQEKDKLRFKGENNTFKIVSAIDAFMLLSEICLVFTLAFSLFPISSTEPFGVHILGRRICIPYAIVVVVCLALGLIPLPLEYFYGLL